MRRGRLDRLTNLSFMHKKRLRMLIQMSDHRTTTKPTTTVYCDPQIHREVEKAGQLAPYSIWQSSSVVLHSNWTFVVTLMIIHLHIQKKPHFFNKARISIILLSYPIIHRTGYHGKRRTIALHVSRSPNTDYDRQLKQENVLLDQPRRCYYLQESLRLPYLLNLAKKNRSKWVGELYLNAHLNTLSLWPPSTHKKKAEKLPSYRTDPKPSWCWRSWYHPKKTNIEISVLRGLCPNQNGILKRQR